MADPAHFNDDTHTLVYKAALAAYELSGTGPLPYFNDDLHTLAYKLAKNMGLFVESQ